MRLGGKSMASFGKLLAAVLALALASSNGAIADDWTQAEASSGPVKFKISGPSDWRSEAANSESASSVAFLSENASPFLRRALGATGTVRGPAKGPVEDPSKLSETELGTFAAMAMEGFTAGRELTGKKLISRSVVEAGAMSALGIVFENSFNTPMGEIYEIIETTVILYNQKSGGQKNENLENQAAINLACSFAGSAQDKKSIVAAFNSEREGVCRKFVDSLIILDK